jgi:hypothetical protein
VVEPRSRFPLGPNPPNRCACERVDAHTGEG